MSRAPFEVTDEMIGRLRTSMDTNRIALSTAIRKEGLSLHSFIKRCPQDLYWELFRYGRKCRFGETAKPVEPRRPRQIVKGKISDFPEVIDEDTVVVQNGSARLKRQSWDGRVDRDRMLGLTLKATFKAQGTLRPEVLKSINKIITSMHSMDSFLDTVDDELCFLEDLGFIMREQRGALRTSLTVLFINLYNIP